MMQELKEKNYLSVVVAINRNCLDIINFIEKIKMFCDKHFSDYEMIFVDNNAPREMIIKIGDFFCNSASNVNIINLPYEVNKEQAILVGVDASIGDVIFEFEDLDVDYTNADLWKMYQTYLDGCDIVLLTPNYSQSFTSRQFYKLLAKYSNKNSVLHHSRIIVVSRRAINYINNVSKTIHYRKYAYCNSGLEYRYVKYDSSRKIHKEKISLDKINFAADLLLIFTDLGKRIALFFSMAFFSLSFLVFVYTMAIYVLRHVVSGWTSIMLFMSVSFAGLFLCFTIVIKYLNLFMTNIDNENSRIGSKRRV